MKRNAIIFILFVLASLLMTYPLVLNMGGQVPGDAGDPLLNVWILAWDAHRILNLDFSGFFDANIFYPYKNTLAFSEHLLGESIISVPAIAVSKNPALAYNIVFLSCFALSGFGTYLLVHYLTKDAAAAFFGGLIFAFFPWRFAHIGHLQLQAAQWIPFTLLYLHRFIDKGEKRHLFIFTGFFILQFMSCGYYALFLSFFVGLLIASEFVKRGFSDREFNKSIGLFLLLSAVVVLPVFYPYVRLKKEMGFTRSIGESIAFSAEPLSYLSAPTLNRMWGRLLNFFPASDSEKWLFPGLVSIFAAGYGIKMIFSNQGSLQSNPASQEKETRHRGLRIFLNALIALSLAASVAGIVSGGSFTVFGAKISLTRIYRPMNVFLAASGIRLLLEKSIRTACLEFIRNFTKPRFYLSMLVLSVLFSFGPYISVSGLKISYGPYFLLHKFFPGFSGLRVPARFAVMVGLALGVFSGYGISALMKGLKTETARKLLPVFLSAAFLVEASALPMPMADVLAGDRIPEVYRRLSKEQGDFAILELPLPRTPQDVWLEARRMYYSTYHWKKLANGYSGYFTPAYDFLYTTGIRNFPSKGSLEMLRELGLKYLVIHSGEYQKDEWEAIRRALDAAEDGPTFAGKYGEACLYEMPSPAPPEKSSEKEIPRQKWVVDAGTGRNPEALTDGKTSTRWTTGRPQQPDDYFGVDMALEHKVSKIVMELGRSINDFPRGYTVEVSKNGKNWETAASETGRLPSIKSIIEKRNNAGFVIRFSPVSCRYVRVVQTGSDEKKYWSAVELRMFGP